LEVFLSGAEREKKTGEMDIEGVHEREMNNWGGCERNSHKVKLKSKTPGLRFTGDRKKEKRFARVKVQLLGNKKNGRKGHQVDPRRHCPDRTLWRGRTLQAALRHGRFG